jgi:hypothetical protein
MMHQSSTTSYDIVAANHHDESDRIAANFRKQNSGPRFPLRIDLPSPPSSVSSLTWRERNDKDLLGEENVATHAKKSTVGLGSVIKLLKEASYEKKVSAGKRKPLGDASNGRMLLESRAASKRELEKVHKKLSELEFC